MDLKRWRGTDGQGWRTYRAYSWNGSDWRRARWSELMLLWEDSLVGPLRVPLDMEEEVMLKDICCDESRSLSVES